MTHKTDNFTTESKKGAIKPNTREAMKHLLDQIEQHFPLYTGEANICQKTCLGCPKKLMEYLQQEYEFWRHALAKNETPLLGDIHKLVKSSTKIHKVLCNNGILIPE